MPPRNRGPPKTIPVVNYEVEAELRERNLNAEMERKKRERELLEPNVKKEDKKLFEVKEDHAQVLTDTQEVISDITREFKVQQNDYRKRIEDLQNELQSLKNQVDEVQMKIRHTSEKFDRQKHLKDEQIQKNIAKAEQMAQEFRDMLKGTLVKMSDRIEMSRESDDNQPLTESANASNEQLLDGH